MRTDVSEAEIRAAVKAEIDRRRGESESDGVPETADDAFESE
jgi:hypothetical protein